jgi:hypothetical protein
VPLCKRIVNKCAAFPVAITALFAAMIVFFLPCCNSGSQHTSRTVEPAFYYWKSSFNLTAYEKAKMDSLHINTLYVKFFDVDWDEFTQQPAPKAVIDFKEKPGPAIIPVVFITNETLQRLGIVQAEILATKMVRLVKELLQKYELPPCTEIQVDCDWSASTKENYFALLKKIKELMPGTLLSATIRLYQTKYYSKAGVPPVDRGLLMCYNMGNLKNMAAGNSIIETAELKKYTANLDAYPLPLDVALPIFNWKVWFRKGRYKGITEELQDSVLGNAVFTKNGNNYTCGYDTLLAGYELNKGDVLRYEKSDAVVVLSAAQLLAAKLKNTRCRVSVYHLDSVLLSKYSINELESMYNSLR